MSIPVRPEAVGSKTLNTSLEITRGLAAVLVVLSHARLFPLLAENASVSGNSWLETALLIPTSFGKESVAVFFVLSGYFVGGQVLRSVIHGRFSWGVFLVKRLSRFWAVLIPGLIFTWLVDAAATLLYSSSIYSTAAERTSLPDAACNAVFLMDSRCQPFGSDDSLWSLGYEFWFYLLFAAAAVGIALLVRKRFVVALATLVIGVLVVFLFGTALLWLIPSWLIGVAIAAVATRAPGRLTRFVSSNTWLAFSICATLAGFAATAVLHLTVPNKFILIGVAIAPLITLLAIRNPRAPKPLARIERWGIWLGTWSFTLYVFHLPILKFLTAAALSLGVTFTPAQVYLLALTVVALSWPTFWLGEAHTPRLKTLLSALIPQRPTPSRNAPPTTELQQTPSANAR